MKNLIILLSCLLFAGSVYGWGQKGHDVTAYIAECHLTPEAAEKIDKALNGHSPVYYANWLDIASHTPEYAYTKTWHYRNVDEGKTIDTMPGNPDGDVLKACYDGVEHTITTNPQHDSITFPGYGTFLRDDQIFG